MKLYPDFTAPPPALPARTSPQGTPAPVRLPRRAARRGIALLMVLFCVVLISGIVVTFLLISLSQRQVALSLASTTQVDLFSQTAANIIIGDLKQEIASGNPANSLPGTTAASNANYGAAVPDFQLPLSFTLSSSLGPNVIQAPVRATNSAGLDAAGGFAPFSSPAASPWTGSPPVPPTGCVIYAYPNLIKMSAAGIPFFGGNNSTKNCYTGAVNAPNLASSVSTTAPSLNGRYVSAADWNKPYFLPVTSATDDTPASRSGITFTAPNWIMVGRDGSNPTSGAVSAAMKKGGTAAVIGRYAYTIYNEGGDLDVNALSNPYNLGKSGNSTYNPQFSTSSDGSLYPASFTPPYHTLSLNTVDFNSLANYILPNASPSLGLISSDETTLGTLPAWRNGASQANYGSSSSFWNSVVLNNTTGFLKPWSLNKNATNTPVQTDELLTSRQALIQYLNQTNINSYSKPLTQGLKNSLNYLTTFSRALNRPNLIAPASGSSANTIPSWSADINPTFSAITVASPGFTRFDGTQALPGDPLVIKRFPLRRLTWLTYAGPSATRTDLMSSVGAVVPTPPTATDAAMDLKLLINSFGIPVSYLQQGTAQRIYDAFGLSWVPDAAGSTLSNNTVSGGEWYYDHSGTKPLTAIGTNNLNILTLTAVKAKNREPDFIELLKAAILNGALGKTIFNSFDASVTDTPMAYQDTFDSYTDVQILQIAANIIDQGDCDGYPTRIAYVVPTDFNTDKPPYPGCTLYTAGTLSNLTGVTSPVEEVYGSESTPYLYSQQPSLVQVVAPVNNAASPTSPSTWLGQTGKPIFGINVGNSQYNFDNYMPPPTPPATTPPAQNPDLTNSGLGVALMQPEMWNPYDPNAPAGAPRPTNYLFGVDATSPENAILGNTVTGPTPIGSTSSLPGGTAYTTWAFFSAANTSGTITNPPGYTIGQMDSRSAISPVSSTGPVIIYNKTNNYSLSTIFTQNLMTSALSFQDPPSGGSVSLGNGSRYSEGTLLSMVGYPQNFQPVDGSTIKPAHFTDFNYFYGGGPASTNQSDWPMVRTWANTVPAPGGTVASNYSPSYIDTGHGGLKSFVSTYNTSGTVFGMTTTYSGINNVTHELTGVLLGWGPLAWLIPAKNSTTGATNYFDIPVGVMGITSPTGYNPGTFNNGDSFTMRTQYEDPNGNYHTFDQKIGDGIGAANPTALNNVGGTLAAGEARYSVDPRTSRWGNWIFDGVPEVSQPQVVYPSGKPSWVDPANNVMGSGAPDRYNTIFQRNEYHKTSASSFNQPNLGWYDTSYPGPGVPNSFAIFALAQNDAQQNPAYATYHTAPAINAFQSYYSDPDGIVRRASGGYSSRCFGKVGGALTTTTVVSSDGNPYAAPLSTAGSHNVTSTGNTNTYGNTKSNQQSNSRPYILNRPYRSVAELGYVFSGTPWKNLDMSTPESGFSGLLEAFCINETDNPQGLVAGKIDLNTRQLPVLEAALTGIYLDDVNPFGNQNLVTINLPSDSWNSTTGPLRYFWTLSTTNPSAQLIAQLLLNRTGDFTDVAQGPLTNLSDLVGKYVGTSGNGNPTAGSLGGLDGTALYSGFSADLSAIYDNATQISGTPPYNSIMINNVPRFREASIRALSAVGQVRVWNLMIDVITQTGEFPPTATTADQFVVNAQHRTWIHLAIDRTTGQVLDEYAEPVTQ